MEPGKVWRAPGRDATCGAGMRRDVVGCSKSRPSPGCQHGRVPASVPRQDGSPVGAILRLHGLVPGARVLREWILRLTIGCTPYNIEHELYALHLQQGTLTLRKRAEEAFQELGKSTAKHLSAEIQDVFGKLMEKVSCIVGVTSCCFETRVTKNSEVHGVFT